MGLLDRLRSARRTTRSSSENDLGTRQMEAQRLIEVGNASEQEGRFTEALQHYETAIRLTPNLARAHLNRGIVLSKMGDPDGALEAYATSLRKDPNYAAAYYNSGNVCVGMGRLEAAVNAYRKAIALKPDFADAEVALGAVLEDLGQPDEAAASYRKALTIKPDYAEVHCNLGNTLISLGQLGEAMVSFRRALAINPGYGEAYNSLGDALQRAGKLDEAVASLHQALAIKPEYAEAYNNLGNALRNLGQIDGAVASYRRAVAIRNDFFEAHSNLGFILKDIALDESVASFRRAVAIKPDSAEAHNNLGVALNDIAPDDAMASFRQALAIKPDYADAHSNLGIVLKNTGQFDAAVESFTRALTIKLDFATAHVNLGVAQHHRGQLKEAAASYRRALAIEPALTIAHNNLGITLTELGQPAAAVVSLKQALSINPDDAGIQSNLLFIQNYLADQPPSQLVEAARCYGNLVARQARPYTAWSNLPNPTRCLRVAIVSGDLVSHPVGFFVDSVVARLASEFSDQLEIIAYPTQLKTDVVTKRISASCRKWQSAVGLSDERFAQLIREDQVDILIDLSGHNAGNRLSMFAWKPAPVQATWIGYFATTGVGAIDYFIADPWTLPESEEVNFTEKILRLPETRFCFTAPDVDVEVSPLPALSNGYVTFGSFNHLAKMNDRVVALWASVLAAVPNSRLFLKSLHIGEASVRQDIVARFTANGVAAERLILEGRGPLAEYFAAYQRVDIALDPFPYTGGATTVQALWMGVPVLTLAGERLVSRQGVGLLMNVGVPEWIARDAADYVTLAVSHTRDLRRLASLRGELRNLALSSPIFDAPRFASHFAAAMRSVWEVWCRRQQDPST